VAFSPDQNDVASVSSDGEVAITDLARLRRRVLLQPGGLGTGVYATTVEYDRDGGRLLIAVSDGTVRFVGVGDSSSQTLISQPGVGVARFDRSGTRVLIAGSDGKARILDLAGNVTRTFRHGAHIHDAAWSPDGRRIATAASDGTVRIWSARTGRMLRELPLDLQALYGLRFSADGRRIVTAGADGVVRLSDVRGGPVIAELKGHREATFSAGFIDASRVYSTGADGTVRTWTLPKIATLPVAGDEPSNPSFSPDGKLALSGYVSGAVRLWNPVTGSVTALPGHAGTAVAKYSANGAYILSWANDGTVRLRDVRHGTSLFIRAPKEPPAVALAIAAAIDPRGRRVAIAVPGKRTVLQAPDGTNSVTLPEHGKLNSLEFSFDAKHVLSASEDGMVRTWNATSGARERVLNAGGDPVLDARYSPDDERIAAAGADGIIRVWSRHGDDPMLLYGHDGPVETVAFDRDGDRLASGGKDGTVRIWDAADGDPLVVLHQHAGSVKGVAFTPDGKAVLSGARDELRLSACEVCGSFPSVLTLARTRPAVTLTAAERRRLGLGGG
jgi:WD40 repeat protein